MAARGFFLLTLEPREGSFLCPFRLKVNILYGENEFRRSFAVTLLNVLLVALTVSLDGFGVGISYGMRRIRLPFASLGILTAVSTFVVFVSMLCGKLLVTLLSPRIANLVGCAILLCLGGKMLIQSWLDEPPKGSSREPENNLLLNFSQILREPSSADVDQSGHIDLQESLVLGLALSMDALGVGFGAAAAGLPAGITSLAVGIIQMLLVRTGVLIGEKSTIWAKKGRKTALLPGLILVGIAIARLC